ncbi:DUF924 domain-containing protein [Paracoccus sp. M683]|uniref:DUF924 family protein n=1 Tax=Paracoccus sp. M683 TaxID=2594268 RepID=UPI00117D3C58|nr:DUF924 family protein [Paracoccus sp. M683]TRW97365.1 DUF924 domain-containing protein [Paracoccus sp. M683]
MATVTQINNFWLNEVGPDGWYQQSDALDRIIRDRFQSTWEQAADLVDDWAATPEGALAALILTDQFPRNMFRGDARSFATDALALRIADQSIAAGFDLATPEPQRQFFYMPFEHSEALHDQERCIKLFAERMPGENLMHAHLHRNTIATFGRFPWRNDALGRDHTEDEEKVMNAGGYGALVSGKLSLADLG